MELYQLTSFVEVIHTENLTRAADNLHISQSALSSQIRLLEDELGVKLFARTPRGMKLTEEGRILHSHATEILAATKSMLAQARELNGRQFGTVKIGLNTDGSFLRVSRMSRNLRDSFPDADLVFVSSQTIHTPEMLRQGLIDIGFFFGECRDAAIHSEYLHTFSIRIVVPNLLLPPGSKLTWQTAANLPWIWSVCDCPYYCIVQAELDSRGLQPRKVVDAMDESVVRELVLDNQGLAILRDDEAKVLADSGKAWIWEDVSFPVELQLGRLKTEIADNTRHSVFSAIADSWRNEDCVDMARQPDVSAGEPL